MDQTQLNWIANFASVQHCLHHLEPTGVAGVIMANGSMSSNKSGEGEITMALLLSS